MGANARTRSVPPSVLSLKSSGEEKEISDLRLSSSHQHQTKTPLFTRKSVLATLPLAAAAALQPAERASASSLLDEGGLAYGRWWVFPLAPYSRKKTVRTEVVKDEVWAFDQIIGALYVWTPLRMTVVKLQKGGLLVFNPVPPTEECLKLVRELEGEHGNVRFVVLGSTALEHKSAAGPFKRHFPSAELWVVPDQYSFPFGLENVGLLGYTQLFWGLNPQPLPLSSDGDVPWKDDLEHVVLGPFKSRGGEAPGVFEDVAFFHKKSKTLLVTDVVQTFPSKIPDIILDDPRALLFHARDDAFGKVQDTPEVRQRGWERIALFSLFFQPGGVEVVPWGQAFKDLQKGQMNELGWNGLFPFTWRPQDGPHPQGKFYWRESVEALKDKCFVPAVLQKLILDREPAKVLAFADRVAQWNFERIVPCHLGSEIKAGPAEFRAAFGFLEDGGDFPGNLETRPLCGDAQFLEDISMSLQDLGTIAAPDKNVAEVRRKRKERSGVSQGERGPGDGWGPFRN